MNDSNELLTLTLKRPDWEGEATLFLGVLPVEDYTSWLHPEELAYSETLTSSRRKSSYLLGRYCAKMALNAELGGLVPAEVLIARGVLGQPVLAGDRAVGIAHSGEFGAAMVYPRTHPMGIDIERITPKRVAVISELLTPGEREALAAIFHDDVALGCAWFWTAKEALGKALLTGLTVPKSVLEVRNIHFENGLITARYTNFLQYKVQSYVWKDVMVSIVLPYKTEIFSEKNR